MNMDVRQFMDFQFADVIAELTRYENSIDLKFRMGLMAVRDWSLTVDMIMHY